MYSNKRNNSSIFELRNKVFRAGIRIIPYLDLFIRRAWPRTLSMLFREKITLYGLAFSFAYLTFHFLILCAFNKHTRWLSYGTLFVAESEFLGKRKVAILICSKSLKNWKNVSDTSLYTTLLPSLSRTIESQEYLDKSIHVFIAYDSSDRFYNNVLNRNAVKSSTNFNLTFISVPKRVRNKIPFNTLALVAQKMGSDFFVRINDDSEFISSAWATLGIKELEALNPKYVGVVGPNCPDGNTRILTHDMVHRTHLEIFGEYYPEVFDNFFVDDWISNVYGSNRTIRMHSWVVRHHIYKHGTRYKARVRKFYKLNSTLIQGRRKIEAYLNRTNNRQRSDRQNLKTAAKDNTSILLP
jgi:hypothetical protein